MFVGSERSLRDEIMAVNENAEKVRKAIEKMLENAQNDGSLNEPFVGELKAKGEGFIKPSSLDKVSKTLIGFKTGTFLDSLFLDEKGKLIDGIPFGTNSLLTGLPNSGKSLLGEEIVLRVAQEHKVCYVLSEEAFRTDSARFDLETRMKNREALMSGLSWTMIEKNLFVLDTVMNAELRDWHSFVQAYRNLVENEKIEFLFVDSMTLLEDARGALKMRVLELMRYNQLHGITSILINQRGIDEADGLAMAGGISLSHIVDMVLIMDYKKISTWDAQLKIDIPDAKQGATVNFFRILKCRICRYDTHYFAYHIDDNGFVTVNPRVIK